VEISATIGYFGHFSAENWPRNGKFDAEITTGRRRAKSDDKLSGVVELKGAAILNTRSVNSLIFGC